jgi:tetratricopeptide (TPR) repeat protein
MKTGFAIALLAVAMLCASVLAQENAAEDWFNKGWALHRNGSNADALAAYNKAIDLNPIFSNAWHGKGEAERALGDVQDAFESSYVAEKLGYEEESTTPP